MFNPKAWSNTDLMLDWIKHIYTPSSKYPLFPRHSTIRPPRLLSLDVFSGQKTKEVIASFKALKCITSFCYGLDPWDVLVPKAPAISSSFLNYHTMCYLGNLSKYLYLY